MKRVVKEFIFIGLIALIIIVVNISKVYSNEEGDGAKIKKETSVAKLTSDGEEKYYDHLDAAIEDASYNDTITLLKDINSSDFKDSGKDVIEISKDINLEFETYTIHSKGFKIKGDADVNFNAKKVGNTQGGITIDKENVHAIEIDEDRTGITLSNIKISDNVNTGEFGVIQLGNGYLYIEGNTYISTNSIVIYVKQEDSAPYISLEGGTIKSKKEPAIILNHGNVYCNGVTIEGTIGIVAYRAHIYFENGTINATGSGKSKINGIDSNTEYEFGTDIIVINKYNGFGIRANVEIKDGTFNSTGPTSLYCENDGEGYFLVQGGTYNKPFDQKFAGEGRLMLHVTNNGKEMWYLGDAANSAVETNKKVSGAVIEVLQGDLSITNAVSGLKVKNSGVGNVTANKQEVEKGSEIVVSQTQIGDNSETQNGGNTGAQEGNTSGGEEKSQTNGITKISPADNTVAGKKLPATGDLKTIVLIASTLLIAASSIVVYKKIRKIEGK